jgi:hypothetical protein
MARHLAHAQHHRHPGQPDPVSIQSALDSAHYPGIREKLLETVRNTARISRSCQQSLSAVFDAFPMLQCSL